MDNLTNIKISVIIPIYNHGDYVVECLRSVVNQQDKNFEIVAIDDGSTDSSYELASEYLCESLVATNWKLTKRENRGINKTLNEAIQNSSGQIIYLLASDDRMPGGSLATIRQTYLNEADGCKLFFYDTALISWQGEVLIESEANQRPGAAQLLAYSKMHLASQIILGWGHLFAHQFFPRDFYNKYGPYCEGLKYEDLYFALKAISEDRFVFTSHILKEYRLRRDQSITPGLTLSDLNEEPVRKIFKNSIKLRYTILLKIGYLCFRYDIMPVKFLFQKTSSLLRKTIYVLTFFCANLFKVKTI